MILLAGIFFAIFFTEIHRFHIKWKLNFRPFNCSSCLAAWVSLALYFIPVAVEPVFYMFSAGALAPIIALLMNHLWQKKI